MRQTFSEVLRRLLVGGIRLKLGVLSSNCEFMQTIRRCRFGTSTSSKQIVYALAFQAPDSPGRLSVPMRLTKASAAAVDTPGPTYDHELSSAFAACRMRGISEFSEGALL
jgi:hypothetical protein